jgi:hypothetical protein
MDFFKAPTDNLYKFTAFGGLALMIVPPLFFFQFRSEATVKIHEYEGQASSVLSEYHELFQDNIPFVERVELAEGKEGKADKKEALHPHPGQDELGGPPTDPTVFIDMVDDAQRDEWIKHLKYHDAVLWHLGGIPLAGDQKAKDFWTHILQMAPNDYDSMLKSKAPDSVIMKTAAHAKQLRAKNQQLILTMYDIWNLSDDIHEYDVLAFVSLIAGTILTVAGILLWSRRVQRFQDEILRNEASSSVPKP